MDIPHPVLLPHITSQLSIAMTCFAPFYSSVQEMPWPLQSAWSERGAVHAGCLQGLELRSAQIKRGVIKHTLSSHQEMLPGGELN